MDQKCTKPDKDATLSGRLSSKLSGKKSLPVSQPEELLKSEDNQTVEMLIGTVPATDDSKENVWIDLSSTIKSGANYSTEIVKKLENLFGSISNPKWTFH